ncbi:hypothetical protein INR49_000752 [Caranx melampygus]|nr:hypothetical protein INR49_000752 [Caranx melampygus]
MEIQVQLCFILRRICKPQAETCQESVVQAAGVTAGTWVKAQTYQGIYASWAVLLLLVLVTLARAFYWACMRVSQPLQNFT